MKILENLFSSPSLIGAASGTAQAKVSFSSMDEEAKFLRKMIQRFGANQSLRAFVLKIIFPACDARDEEAQALAIAEWVQDNVTYVHEGFETFQTPSTTIKLRAGDCDDMTTLICAMLASVGIANKMVLVQIDGRWAHIYPIALVRADGEVRRLVLDATLAESVRENTDPLVKVKDQGRKVTRTIVA